MGTTLQQILSGRNLVGLIQGVKPGLPMEAFPPALLNVTKRVEGNYCTYRKSEGTQQVARFTQYGAPGRKQAPSSLSEVPVKLLHTKEEVTINASTLVNLESTDGAKQRLAEEELSRIVAECKQRLVNARYAAVLSVFGRQGLIDVDTDGNILPDTSGSVYQIDYSIPANNKDQANGIIGATWATDSTDVIGDVIALKAAAAQLTGYPLKNAIHGANLPDYLLTNNVVKELINRNANSVQNSALAGEIPNGTLGWNWYAGYMGFFDNSSGSAQQLVTGDELILFPEVNTGWWDFVEGSCPVPNGALRVGADLSDTMRDVSLVSGMFAYAFLDPHSMSATMVYGDTFLPMLTVPDAVYCLDVVP